MHIQLYILTRFRRDRFFAIPPFGLNGIRRFPLNVSEMRQRAARHFEDILQVRTKFEEITTLKHQITQCSIPAFEGLFPEDHDSIIRVLLFRLAEWHALAKLRLHSDDSLRSLDRSLRRLADQIRKFQRTTCSAYHTEELPSEAAA